MIEAGAALREMQWHLGPDLLLVKDNAELLFTPRRQDAKKV
jgi:hypothetical protein